MPVLVTEGESDVIPGVLEKFHDGEWKVNISTTKKEPFVDVEPKNLCPYNMESWRKTQLDRKTYKLPVNIQIMTMLSQEGIETFEQFKAKKKYWEFLNTAVQGWFAGRGPFSSAMNVKLVDIQEDSESFQGESLSLALKFEVEGLVATDKIVKAEANKKSINKYLNEKLTFADSIQASVSQPELVDDRTGAPTKDIVGFAL